MKWTRPGRALLAAGLLCVAAAAQARTPVDGIEATPEGEQALRTRMRLEPEARFSYQDSQGRPLAFAEFVAQVKAEGSLMMRKTMNSSEIVLRVQRGKTPEELKAAEAAERAAFKLKPGEPIGDFKLEGLDGKPYEKAALAGRVSVLSFFFEACAPCIAEVPALNKFRELHPELNLVAVTFDDRARAQRFQDRHKLSWPILIESRKFNQALGVAVYPSFVVLDAEGRLLGYKVLGTALKPEEAAGSAEHAALAAWIKELLAKPAGKAG